MRAEAGLPSIWNLQEPSCARMLYFAACSLRESAACAHELQRRLHVLTTENFRRNSIGESASPIERAAEFRGRGGRPHYFANETKSFGLGHHRLLLRPGAGCRFFSPGQNPQLFRFSPYRSFSKPLVHWNCFHVCEPGVSGDHGAYRERRSTACGPTIGTGRAPSLAWCSVACS